MSASVSVLIPAYNAQRWIARTLSSVAGQTMPDFEAIVVDDGSCDATPDIVADFAARDARFTLIRQANAGVTAARNRAAASARGRFLAPLDADDLWAPTNLARQIEALAASPDAPFSFARTYLIDADDIIIAGVDSSPLPACTFEALLAQNFIGNGSACVIRREAFAAVGGYDARFRQGGEDWLLTLRLALLAPFTGTPEPLIGYRQTDNGFSHAKLEAMCENLLACIDAARRAAPHISAQTYRDATSNGLAWYLPRLWRAKRFDLFLRFAGHAYLANPLALRLPLPREVATKGLWRARRMENTEWIGKPFPVAPSPEPGLDLQRQTLQVGLRRPLA